MQTIIMKVTDIVLIALFLFVELSNAQTGFRSGYIIKNEGDTLFGQVDFQSEGQMSRFCRFKQQDSLKVREYFPFEISGYRFTDGKYYVSKRINNKNVFLEFLIKGKVNLYFYFDENVDRYFIEKDSLNFTEIPYQEVYKIKGNNEVLIRSKKHFGVLTYFMQDAPGLKTEILSIQQPDRKNLMALVKDYHNAICNGEACIVYENKPPIIKVNLECFIGSMNIRYDVNEQNSTHTSTGVLAHIWLPSFSEDCFFRTGLIYVNEVDHSSGYTDRFASDIRIPLQIEYVFPSKIVQPKLAIGTTVYTTTGGPLLIPVTSIMLGVNVKLTKKAFLAFNYDLDSDSDYLYKFTGTRDQSFSVGFNLTL